MSIWISLLDDRCALWVVRRRGVRLAAGMVRIGLSRFRLFSSRLQNGMRGILFSGEEEASFAEEAYSFRT
ncbi:hypothetical protein EKK70_06115 [Desulfovibrio sp. DS-1]|nr:hypothetical protein EKK70_06115 [Desulfovibrio sp. DS-1]